MLNLAELEGGDWANYYEQVKNAIHGHDSRGFRATEGACGPRGRRDEGTFATGAEAASATGVAFAVVHPGFSAMGRGGQGTGCPGAVARGFG